MRKAILAVIILVVIAPCPAQQQKVDWQYLNTSGNNKHYVNRNSVRRTTEGILKVWVKYLPVDLEVERKKETEDSTNEKASQYVRYAYALTLFDVDCTARTFRVRQVDDYDVEGMIIRSAGLKESEADWLKGRFSKKLADFICPRTRKISSTTLPYYLFLGRLTTSWANGTY